MRQWLILAVPDDARLDQEYGKSSTWAFQRVLEVQGHGMQQSLMVSNHPNISERYLSLAVTNETLIIGVTGSDFVDFLCKCGKHTFRKVKSIIKPPSDAVEAAVGALVATSSASWCSLDLALVPFHNSTTSSAIGPSL